MAQVLAFLVQESTSHCRLVASAPGAPLQMPVYVSGRGAG